MYYTHTAATAGTTANMGTDGQEATGSVCPKGWRMPSTALAAASLDNDFYVLANEYKGTATWQGTLFDNGHEMVYGAAKFIRAGFKEVGSSIQYINGG